MSFRCSLLGHTYGEAEIEREREEEGTEVVVTVREFQECERCGERRIVTENKEVTAIEAPDTEPEPAGAAGGGAASGTGQSGVASGGVGGTGSATDVTEATAPSVDDEFERPQSAEEDDAIILDDDGDDEDDGSDAGGDDDRQPGEWPEADSTHPAEVDGDGPTPWPDVGQEDEGFDAEVGDGASADVEFGGGLQPESAPEVDENEEVEFVNAEGDTLAARDGSTGGSSTARRSRPELSTGFTSSGSVPAPDGPSEEAEPDAEFVCPNCGHSAPVSGSSMRAGDICPECRKGYIARE
ncbi:MULTISPECIES: DUF7093 family protein [Halorussus]|uniref:DUF7093 family protein n=1 Tax=Halorussus TaxID=1070314 RepID=UPI00209E6351|nr:oxidoreductase [Halorussus vallis]USZ74759.1 oxidoreductase [Halorussus vallis]